MYRNPKALWAELTEIANRYGSTPLLQHFESSGNPDEIFDFTYRKVEGSLLDAANNGEIPDGYDPQAAIDVAYVVARMRLHISGIETLKKAITDNMSKLSPDAAEELLDAITDDGVMEYLNAPPNLN